jgi:hypothetical protein
MIRWEPMNSGASKRFGKVYVEIGNVCNLQCDFCPPVERGAKRMERGLFERVIAQAAPLAERVCLHLMGEPLAHPEFADFVAVCAAHGLPVEIATNGTLLGGARSAALLRPIVAQVNFSVHSFAANFPGRDVGPYLAEIFRFTRRAFAERPELYVNYRLWNLGGADAGRNEDVIARVEKEFGVALERGVDVRRRKSRRVLNRLSLHFDTRFDWPRPDGPELSESGTCRALSAQFGVLADGSVVPCCLDKEGATVLGDANERPLAEILDGERARRMLEGFARGRLVEDLCRRCTFIARFDGQARRRRAAAPVPA